MRTLPQKTRPAGTPVMPTSFRWHPSGWKAIHFLAFKKAINAGVWRSKCVCVCIQIQTISHKFHTPLYTKNKRAAFKKGSNLLETEQNATRLNIFWRLEHDVLFIAGLPTNHYTRCFHKWTRLPPEGREWNRRLWLVGIKPAYAQPSMEHDWSPLPYVQIHCCEMYAS